MNQTRFVFFAAIATNFFCIETNCISQVDTKCANCHPQQSKPSNSEETGKVVIASFLNMFAQFLNMATNPHDKEILVAGGMGIAQSLAAIATQACKTVELEQSSPEELLTYVTTQCANAQIDPYITDQLTRAIKQQYWKSALLPQETRGRYAEYAEHSDMLND